jgi:hypothetical protein
MTDSTLMTDTAAPTEGQPASTTPATETAATATDAGNQQAAQGSAAPTTDTKPGDANNQGDAGNAEDGKPADDAGKSQGAPEEYADFQLPDGVQLDAELTSDLKAVAKELNLTQEQAQKLADLAANKTQAIGANQMEAIKAAQAQWADSSKADKEFGGEALAENLSVAKKALDTFGTPELRTLLNESGLGNHPEIIRAFYRAGKAISEDRFVPSGAGGRTGGRADPAKSLYPNQQT